MRVRYRTVLYHVEDSESLQQYYQQLVDDLVRQAQSSPTLSRTSGVWRPPTDIHKQQMLTSFGWSWPAHA